MNPYELITPTLIHIQQQRWQRKKKIKHTLAVRERFRRIKRRNITWRGKASSSPEGKAMTGT